MQKKSISKHLYLIFNILFHSLCLAGLLLQVTKVSIDFFHYEVMKDINIIMPEEVKKDEKVFFICISSSILDMDKYRKISATKDFDRSYNESEAFKDYRKGNKTPPPSEVVKMIFSAEERIATFSNITKFEEFNSRRSLNSSNFFFGHTNCFQVNNYDFYMKKSNIEYLHIHLSGKPLPYFYKELLFYVPNLKSLQSIFFDYYSYSIMRLEKPYQNECYNYKTTKQAAIAECIHAMFPGNQFYSDYDLFDENNHAYQNQTYRYIHFSKAEKCKGKYIQSPCNETMYFNQINMIRKYDELVHNETDFDIYSPNDTTNPSFTMESRARINLIDFITYIMGALGSWIGFSFLLINPVPLIFKIRDNAISDPEATPPDSNQDGILNINRLDKDRMKSRIRSIEYKLHTIDQRLGEMAQDVSQQRSAQEQKMAEVKLQLESKLDQILKEMIPLKNQK